MTPYKYGVITYNFGQNEAVKLVLEGNFMVERQ